MSREWFKIVLKRLQETPREMNAFTLEDMGIDRDLAGRVWIEYESTRNKIKRHAMMKLEGKQFKNYFQAEALMSELRKERGGDEIKTGGRRGGESHEIKERSVEKG